MELLQKRGLMKEKIKDFELFYYIIMAVFHYCGNSGTLDCNFLQVKLVSILEKHSGHGSLTQKNFYSIDFMALGTGFMEI